ncbi:hypothetical protein C8R46DRAFT_1042304 [Mycena filopes]|nr:hypothetical protein C8R46DRAFT_1042304 [Mycena filopes]
MGRRDALPRPKFVNDKGECVGAGNGARPAAVLCEVGDGGADRHVPHLYSVVFAASVTSSSAKARSYVACSGGLGPLSYAGAVLFFCCREHRTNPDSLGDRSAFYYRTCLSKGQNDQGMKIDPSVELAAWRQSRRLFALCRRLRAAERLHTVGRIYNQVECEYTRRGICTVSELECILWVALALGVAKEIKLSDLSDLFNFHRRQAQSRKRVVADHKARKRFQQIGRLRREIAAAIPLRARDATYMSTEKHVKINTTGSLLFPFTGGLASSLSVQITSTVSIWPRGLWGSLGSALHLPVRISSSVVRADQARPLSIQAKIEIFQYYNDGLGCSVLSPQSISPLLQVGIGQRAKFRGAVMGYHLAWSNVTFPIPQIIGRATISSFWVLHQPVSMGARERGRVKFKRFKSSAVGAAIAFAKFRQLVSIMDLARVCSSVLTPPRPPRPPPVPPQRSERCLLPCSSFASVFGV